jgi:NitT/TauT family transport system substrate-binding protein
MTSKHGFWAYIFRVMAGLTVLGGLSGMTMAVQAETPVLKVAVLKFGTVNWELNTIAHHQLDAKHGFKLEVQGVAGEAAAKIGFQGGTADMMVSDWIWVARQRAAGKDFVFIPYSKAVGGLMVPGNSPAQSLGDMKGGKIGVAGGPLDKSWILMQALARKRHGFDLAREAEPVFGAPPLIFKQALQGEMTGAINFWHFMARMEAAGMRRLISVADAATALGLDPETPLLGYIVKGDLVRDKPELVAGFAAASREAKQILENDDKEWDRLRPVMNTANDAEFAALKAGFREGIPSPEPIDEKAAANLFAVMADLGGADLVGEATKLPDGIFYQAGQ